MTQSTPLGNLEIGDSFTFRGERYTVTEAPKRGDVTVSDATGKRHQWHRNVVVTRKRASPSASQPR